MQIAKEEVLKDIGNRLKLSNPKKWEQLSNNERALVVQKYFEIRNEDYQDISFLLRENVKTRREFSLLFIGVIVGVLANPISAIITKYLPSTTFIDDLLNVAFFGLLLFLMVVILNRLSAESLDDDNVIDRLLEVAKRTPPHQKSQDTGAI